MDPSWKKTFIVLAIIGAVAILGLLIMLFILGSFR